MTGPDRAIELRVTADLGAAVEDDGIAARATRYLEDMCGRLGLPLEATVEPGPTDPPGSIRIGDHWGTVGGDGQQPQDAAATIALALHRHRELLVTEPVARLLWDEWKLGAGSTETFGFRAFHELLRESVRWGRSVQRLREALHQNPSLAAEAGLERSLTAAGLPGMRILLSPGAYERIFDSETGTYRRLDDKDRDFGSMLEMMTEGFFYELGVLFRVEHDVDESLAEEAFRLEWNDITLPPQVGLPSGHFLVNDTVERLRLLKLEGEPATNPANGSEGAVLQGGPEARQECESIGLTTWSPEGYLILAASAEVRRNAGAFLTTALSEFFLNQIAQAFPDLVGHFTKRFDDVRLTRVLRTLLDEEISIRDLRAILESLLALEGTTSADHGKLIVFGPNAGTMFPVTDGRGLPALTAEELAECARMALKRYISHKYTRGQSTLIVYLLDPDIEARIAARGDEPLPSAERSALLSAVRAEVASLPSTARLPAVLTVIEVRRRMRRLVEHEFPRLAVLSYNELSPDMNIQPIARISLE